MDSTPILSDGLITLRNLRAEDAPEITAAVRASLPELAPWMDWAVPDYSEYRAHEWIIQCQDAWQNCKGFQFVITDAVSGQILGSCGLNGINDYYRFANLGYWVRTSRTRQGIASRATRLVARFGFEHANLLRAEIVIAIGNLPSQYAAQKAGATREGILRNRMAVGEKQYDAVMFSLIPADFGL